jgi:hypothetical protein
MEMWIMKKECKQRFMGVLRTQYAAASKAGKARIIERVIVELEVGRRQARRLLDLQMWIKIAMDS